MKRSRLILSFLIASVIACYGSTPEREDDDCYEVWEPYEASPADSVDSEPTAACWGIMGEHSVDVDAICRFVRRRNPDFPSEIAEAFIDLGRVYGIRGDMALCQAIVETGWFRFSDGTAVKPEQHNYCGLGVTRRGVTGESFDCIRDGVRAQLQHLYAYACRKPLPDGEPLLDPRFRLVSRGIAPNWHDLSNRWAMNPNYGNQIVGLYQQLIEETNALK